MTGDKKVILRSSEGTTSGSPNVSSVKKQALFLSPPAPPFLVIPAGFYDCHSGLRAGISGDPETSSG